ncbi:alkaline ceramidase-like [Bidens hawaiensis]|uniref:alkaline ceramidase-like n=1 Tax=Bidens hawaiensis TaxID=980011 RepID=UPI00404B2393
MALAIRSMMYHATLQHVQQQSDETPMVWEMLLYIYILYSPDWHYRSTMPTFLFLYGISFAVIHSVIRFDIGFKIHYVMLCILCIPRVYKYYIYTQDIPAKRLAKFYIATLLLGSLCWLVDRFGCSQISTWQVNPQGHAMWHVFMGLNSYFANTFLMFCRAQQRGWSPKVVKFMGVLPYVRIEKPKTD